MRNEKKYAYSLDGYSCFGDYCSEISAIENMKKNERHKLKDGCKYYIMEGRKLGMEISLDDVVEVITIGTSAYIDDECVDNLLNGITRKDKELLADMLTKTLNDWIKQTNRWQTFSVVDFKKEYTYRRTKK